MEMSQRFSEDGTVIPVTRIQAGPCLVVDKLTEKKHGYTAIKVAYNEIPVKKLTNSLKGLFNKALGKEVGYRFIKEFRMNEKDEMYSQLEIGTVIDVSMFKPGDIVDIKGTSKGHGFQGVVKRHDFKGGKASHGHKDQLRMPGSIGAGGLQRVIKGMRMGGHMGDATITAQNIEIVEVLPETNELLIKGAVPGARNSLLFFKGEGSFEIRQAESKAVEPVVAEVKTENEEVKTEVAGKEEVKA